MPSGTVTQHPIFRKLHTALTIFLLLLVSIYFFIRWIDMPCPSYTLVRQEQITGHLWLYVLDTDGGALSSDWFKYYLEEKLEGDPIPQLADKFRPFLITNNKDAKISLIKNPKDTQPNIKIETAGRIYDFETSPYDSPRIYINTIPKALKS